MRHADSSRPSRLLEKPSTATCPFSSSAGVPFRQAHRSDAPEDVGDGDGRLRLQVDRSSTAARRRSGSAPGHKPSWYGVHRACLRRRSEQGRRKRGPFGGAAAGSRSGGPAQTAASFRYVRRGIPARVW